MSQFQKSAWVDFEEGKSMRSEKKLNQVFDELQVRDYEKKRYRGWDQRLVDWREKKIIKKILEKLGKELNLILDLPCGFGRFSKLFLKRGLSLVSSDLSFSMVKRTKNKSEGNEDHFFVVGDVKKGIPFKDGAFEAVFCIRFFHHLHEREERDLILREFNRVSTRWLILSYYRWNFFHSIQRKLRRKLKRSKTEIKMLSPFELESEVESSGFHIIQTFPLFKRIHSQEIALLEKD